MPSQASVVADSVSPNGVRLTTMLISEHRFVHAEHLRHRSFSYSVASSRALPISKLIEQVMVDPAMPVYWGKLAKGMGAKEELTGIALEDAHTKWLRARDRAVKSAQELSNLEGHEGLSKELANRLLEPWMWVTALVTGTEWENFWWLRCHPAAQPEMRHAAERMKEAYDASTPKRLPVGSWHMPFTDDQDWFDAEEFLFGEREQPVHYASPGERLSELRMIQEAVKQVSAGRAARTSYLTHLGKRDLREDVRLFGDLVKGMAEDPPQPGHLSPLEHQATPLAEDEWVSGVQAYRIFNSLSTAARRDWQTPERLQKHLNMRANLHGWKSQRWLVPGEAGPEAPQTGEGEGLSH